MKDQKSLEAVRLYHVVSWKLFHFHLLAGSLARTGLTMIDRKDMFIEVCVADKSERCSAQPVSEGRCIWSATLLISFLQALTSSSLQVCGPGAADCHAAGGSRVSAAATGCNRLSALTFCLRCSQCPDIFVYLCTGSKNVRLSSWLV